MTTYTCSRETSSICRFHGMDEQEFAGPEKVPARHGRRAIPQGRHASRSSLIGPDVGAVLLAMSLRWIAARRVEQLLFAAVQNGRRSRRFPQHDTHGVEQVDGYPDASGACHTRRAHPEHAPQLKDD